MTSTVQADTVALSIPYALQALGQHMLDRGLPAPYDVRLPRGEDEPRLTIWLEVAEAYDWLDAETGFAVDDISVVPSVKQGWENVRYDGRLPDTGVRVRIQWTRPITRTLNVVPA